MPKSPAYQWYPKDALTSQRLGEMTLEEEGAYRRALDSCWLAGSLPNDPVRLARIIGKGCSEEVARVVLAMFDITSEDGVRVMHDTLERERRKQADWREKSALGGKRSAGKRKHPKTLGDEQGGSDVVDTNSPPNGNIAVSCLQSSSSKEIKHILPSRKPRSKKELTGLPDDFPITDDMRSWFAEKCPNLEIERET